ncbi:MAG: ABC transporter permease [Solirubrobacteraceae bacterium]|nr:ABC transporter permease [Solirubrobacteraceae bacterium]
MGTVSGTDRDVAPRPGRPTTGGGPTGAPAPRPPRTPLVDGWRSGLLQAAGMAILAGSTARRAVRRPWSWKADCLEQAEILVVRCTLPLALAVFAFGFGTIGVQAGLVFDALGGVDRTGGIFVTGSVRELATWATAMVVAGVGGTAICADLGARRVREELDALEVIGVDPVRSLVVPRVVALAIVTPMLTLVAVLFCTIAGICAVLVLYDTTVPSFAASFKANFATPDLYGSLLKTFAFGVIIAIVCCYKGLHASGGAQGVGRAVNQAVVIAFVVLWIFNYAFTSVLLASFPELQALR